MLHDGQRRILASARRMNAVACGRRFGKTTLGLALAAYGAPRAPGGLLAGYPVGWFAPSYKLLDEAWRAARLFLRRYIIRTDAQQKRIELSTGGTLDMWTLLDESCGRGRKYSLVVIDEAGASPYLRSAWELSIRPTLTDLRGCAWFLSTPRGRNHFWSLYQLAASSDEWASHHAPSGANPYLDPAEIEAARSSLPERVYRQEYLAEFLEDGGGVFRGVDTAPRCAWQDAIEPTADRTEYIIGVDWGRSHDFTALAVWHSRAGQMSLVHIDRFTGIGYELQTGRLRALWDRFGRCPVIAEANSMGGPLIESLQAQDVPVRPFQTTNSSKAEAIEALALGLERGNVALADDPRVSVLTDELLAYTMERLPSGLVRYGAPADQHDDCVMAAAIGHAAVVATPQWRVIS